MFCGRRKARNSSKKRLGRPDFEGKKGPLVCGLPKRWKKKKDHEIAKEKDFETEDADDRTAIWSRGRIGVLSGTICRVPAGKENEAGKTKPNPRLSINITGLVDAEEL